MNSQYIFNPHDAPRLNPTSTWVTVTHPHHPLHGQKLEVVRTFGKKGFLLRKPDGSGLAQISRSWTDYDGAQYEPNTSDSNHLLDVDGLREIGKIISQLAQAGVGVKRRGRGELEPVNGEAS
jgi:hypothetical protein